MQSIEELEQRIAALEVANGALVDAVAKLQRSNDILAAAIQLLRQNGEAQRQAHNELLHKLTKGAQRTYGGTPN